MTCLATSGFDAGLCLSNWMNSVAPTGTFTKASGVTWPTGPSGIPSGWNIVNDGPAPDYVFSVSSTKTVHFSPGNLQYKSGEGWRFAESQLDVCQGTDGAWNTSSWVDLFGWGTWTGNNPNPLNQSGDPLDYSWNSSDFQGTLDGHDDWYTLSKDEWNYLFSHSTFGIATVNGRKGIIILPDGCSITGLNTSHNSWSNNTVDASTWASTYEANGAVFLPVTGLRWDDDVYGVADQFSYWTSTEDDDEFSYCLSIVFDEEEVTANGSSNNINGRPVRLVR